MKRFFARAAALLLALCVMVSPAYALTVEQAIPLLEQHYVDELPSAAYQAKTMEELIQAIQLAELQIGSKGVRKDKSGEKTIESDTNLPLELRTDGTDAWDTNFLGCLTRPYDDDGFIYG